MLQAQTGTIQGIVYEADGTLPLIGANIYLKSDLTFGTSSEIDGSYVLKNIPVGTHTFVYSYLGYEIREQEVTIEENKTVMVNAVLGAVNYDGAEILVTAQALGQAKAIHEQINSESIANIVSAARIQELPDVNAAEAIARLPGIAINRSGGEGQKVVIRGMSPKFAAITVNGIRLPSNSSSDRSVDLSLISPELLDGIEVFKSPMPDMDAESIGGTVNLRLRKAPKDFKLLAKGLSGFNILNSDFKDYKGVFQVSNRIFNDKLGIVFQTSIERFNRGGDFLTNSWRQGPTDSMGVTAIYGNTLKLEDRKEIRKRRNASISLDYNIGKNNFSFFGLYSGTFRNKFSIQEKYAPSEPAITFYGTEIENKLQLTSFSLQGEHTIGKSILDWTIASSNSRGETPYNYTLRFENNSQVFDPSLDADSNPSNFYGAATPDFANTYLRTGNFDNTATNEKINTAVLNYKLPYTITEKITGYFKTGVKYSTTARNRDKTRQSEDFYYLGGTIGRQAIDAATIDLVLLPDNDDLISILSFDAQKNDINFNNEKDENIGLKINLDPDIMRQWYEDQKDLMHENRAAIVENYEVNESITAGYAMFKMKFGKKLSIIPGIRYEYSDNEYRSGVSTLSGRYGVNGIYKDTTTNQTYGEFLPHLHIKYQLFDWMDMRFSFATTLARPDFNFITPRSQINNNSLVITSGNPDLKPAKAQNYDLFFTAFKGNFGLLSMGAFYKEIDDIFYSWKTNLVDQETADLYGWSNYLGYELRSYINSGKSTIKGFEIDFQTNLRFLPKPFNGLVLNLNYARLQSETEAYFLSSESKLIIPFPPIFETTYTNHTRIVAMPNQPKDVFNASIGYDYKKFSCRVSGNYQGSKASSYSTNKDFDKFTLQFWRWDASIKQRFKDHWSFFLNINNFTNQQDISYTRNENYINTIQTYGMTGTIGIQYRIK